MFGTIGSAHCDQHLHFFFREEYISSYIGSRPTDIHVKQSMKILGLYWSQHETFSPTLVDSFIITSYFLQKEFC